MRRHTAKGVVSSKKLGDHHGDKVEVKLQPKDGQSNKRKRKTESETESGQLSIKKHKSVPQNK